MSELGRAESAAAVTVARGGTARAAWSGCGSCPFDRRLAVVVPAARTAVAAGLVDEGDFDAERLGRTAEELLVEAEQLLPGMTQLEAGDLAVVHGDACLPNALVDPETLRFAGWVDLGRLGVADRHWDLALATRSTGDEALNPGFGPDAAAELLRAYALPADDGRLAFYRLLDEFF